MEDQGKKRPPFRRTKYLTSKFPRKCILLLSLFSFNFILLSRTQFLWNKESKPDIAEIQKCAIENLHADLSFLDAASPIRADEFLDRRDRLARALVASEADAFILEPGYTFQ